jgi:MFS transporter, NNP family, nitrate/nitrite transporter
MSLAVDTVDDPAVAAAAVRTGRRITDWRPEDAQFWRTTGRRVATRNLVWSVVTEHIGFSMWSLWSVIVLFLGPKYHVDAAGKFTLTAVPTVVGSALRLPYTFAVAKFGGRNWTIVSSLLLVVPTGYLAVVLKPGVSYSTLIIGAALAGVGGGNFASSMANINSFYPSRLKGWALGINAGGGNIGVAAVQLVGLFVLAAAGTTHPRLMLAIYIPLIALAALAAAAFMDNVEAHNPERAMRDATHDPHTWVISLLYIGTFGSFIGFSFAFGQVLQVQFHAEFATPLKAAQLTFLGPLLGSLARPVGGWLADRWGGARVTFASFIGLAIGAALVTVASLQKSLGLFLTGFVVLFILSGVGNGSTYKMIPAIFRARQHSGQLADAARTTAAVIGIAGAVGAFGGVLVNLAFRQSFLSFHNADSAYLGFVAFYLVCVTVTWAGYLGPAATGRLGARV